MRILFTSSARRFGGTERWLCLAGAVLADHHEVALAFRDEAVGARWQWSKARMPFFNAVDIITIASMVALIRRGRFSAVVPTKRKDYLLAGIAGRFAGVRVIARLGILRLPPRRLSWIYAAILGGFIVNARCIADALGRRAALRRLPATVVYNCVDLDAVAAGARAYAPAIPFRFAICSVGELSARKNTAALLHAFARIAAHPRLPRGAGCVLIGEGPEMRRLTAAASAIGDGGRALFTGALTNPWPYVNACDIFVLVSRSEGISNAVLEAMALGRPVVCARAGGMEEIIEHGVNGLLVRPGDEDDLAGQILALAGDPALRERLGSAARTAIAERHAPAQMRRGIERALAAGMAPCA